LSGGGLTGGVVEDVGEADAAGPPADEREAGLGELLDAAGVADGVLRDAGASDAAAPPNAAATCLALARAAPCPEPSAAGRSADDDDRPPCQRTIRCHSIISSVLKGLSSGPHTSWIAAPAL
jgi:hypothetical protein